MAWRGISARVRAARRHVIGETRAVSVHGPPKPTPARTRPAASHARAAASRSRPDPAGPRRRVGECAEPGGGGLEANPHAGDPRGELLGEPLHWGEPARPMKTRTPFESTSSDSGSSVVGSGHDSARAAASGPRAKVGWRPVR